MRRLKDLVKKAMGVPPSSPPPAPTRSPAPAPARFALWSIGIYTGTSPLTLAPDERITNPVVTREIVTDVPASFVADPFLMRANGRWHLFFELFNRTTGRGEIGVATSDDLSQWQYQRVVLREPFHLSYPFVFEWNGSHYMMPESHEASSIRLYKATKFPGEWTHVHTLLDDDRYSDSTLFRHDDQWWLFTQTSPGGKHDNLRLFFAADLFGAWTEHPASPVVQGNANTARPAGRVVSADGKLLRFAQVCTPQYGASVSAFEITTLTRSEYVERTASDLPILTGSGHGWNADRMHHMDAHRLEDGRYVAAVDGAANTTLANINGTG